MPDAHLVVIAEEQKCECSTLFNRLAFGALSQPLGTSSAPNVLKSLDKEQVHTHRDWVGSQLGNGPRITWLAGIVAVGRSVLAMNPAAPYARAMGSQTEALPLHAGYANQYAPPHRCDLFSNIPGPATKHEVT